MIPRRITSCHGMGWTMNSPATQTARRVAGRWPVSMWRALVPVAALVGLPRPSLRPVFPIGTFPNLAEIPAASLALHQPNPRHAARADVNLHTLTAGHRSAGAVVRQRAGVIGGAGGASSDPPAIVLPCPPVTLGDIPSAVNTCGAVAVAPWPVRHADTVGGGVHVGSLRVGVHRWIMRPVPRGGKGSRQTRGQRLARK